MTFETIRDESVIMRAGRACTAGFECRACLFARRTLSTYSAPLPSRGRNAKSDANMVNQKLARHENQSASTPPASGLTEIRPERRLERCPDHDRGGRAVLICEIQTRPATWMIAAPAPFNNRPTSSVLKSAAMAHNSEPADIIKAPKKPSRR